MIGSDYFRQQARICLRLSRIGSKPQMTRELVERAKQHLLKAERLEQRCRQVALQGDVQGNSFDQAGGRRAD
jgi:hypothetical protein